MKKPILFTVMSCLTLLICACGSKTDEPASGPQKQGSEEAAPSEESTIPAA